MLQIACQVRFFHLQRAIALFGRRLAAPVTEIARVRRAIQASGWHQRFKVVHIGALREIAERVLQQVAEDHR